MIFSATASRSNSNKNKEIKNCLLEMFLVSLFVSLCMVRTLYALDDGMHDYSRNKEAYNRPHYGDQSHPAKSCAAIFKQLPNLPSGVYWLDVYDAENNKTIQEKHYCQNTVSNETNTGLKYKGQQKEIGIEDLSLGPPDPEPFDWEELTGENWPLPITPPSKEEMKQRLQKAVKDYKEKMKEKNKENSGSNLIWNLIGGKINAPILDHKTDRTEANEIHNSASSRFNTIKYDHKVDNTEPNVMQNSVYGRANVTMNNLAADRHEPNFIRNSVSNQINDNTTDNSTDLNPPIDVTLHYPKAPDSTEVMNYVDNSGVDQNQSPAMTGVATSSAGNSSIGDQYTTTENLSNRNPASSPVDSVASNLSVDIKHSKQYNQSGTESNAGPDSREDSWRNSTPNLAENYAGLSYTAQSIAKEFLSYRYDSNASSVLASEKMHFDTNDTSAAAYGQTQNYNNLNWTPNNASSYGREIPYYSIPDAANSTANRLNSNVSSYSQGAVTYGPNYSKSYRNDSSYQEPISVTPMLQTYNLTSALPYYHLPTVVNDSYDQTSNFSLSISSVADGYEDNAVNRSVADNDAKLETYNGGNELLRNYSTIVTNATSFGVSSNEVGNAANTSNESKDISMSYYHDAGYKVVANDSSRLPAATTSLPASDISMQVPYFPRNAVNDSYQGAVAGDNAQAMSTERIGVASLNYNSSGYQPFVNENNELRNHNRSSQSPVFVSTNLNDSYRGDVINGTSYSQVTDTSRDNATSQAMADSTVEMPSYNLPSYLPYHKVQLRVGAGGTGENKNTLSHAQDFYRENPNPSIESFGKEDTDVIKYNATRQPPSYSQPSTVDSGYHGFSYNATGYSQPATVDNGHNGMGSNATSYSQPSTVDSGYHGFSYNATGYSQPTTVDNGHNGMGSNATSYSQPSTVDSGYHGVSYNATGYSQSTTVENGHNGVSYNATSYYQPTTVDNSHNGESNNATSYSQPATVDNGYKRISYNATSYLRPTMLNDNYSENSYNTMKSTNSTGKQQQNAPNAPYFGYFHQTTANASAEVHGYNVTANLPSYYQPPIVNDSKAEPTNNDLSRLPGADKYAYYGYTVNRTSILPLYNKGHLVSSTVDFQAAVNKQQNPGLYNEKDGYEPTANSNQLMPNYNYSSTSLPINFAVNHQRETAIEGSSKADFRNVTGNVGNASVVYRKDGVSEVSLNHIAQLPTNSSLQLDSNMITQASDGVNINQFENSNSLPSNDKKSYPTKASNEMINASSRYDMAALNLSTNFLAIGNKAKENDCNITTPIKTIASTKYASIIRSSTNSPAKAVGTTRNNVNKPDDGQRSVKMMLLKLRQVVASPKLKGSVTEVSSRLEKGLSSKYLQREGLFVKPGLNRGVIETIVTKDTVNASKPKSAHAITREVIISNSSNASSSQSQSPSLLQTSKLTSEKLEKGPSSPDRLNPDDSETNKARAQLIKLWHRTDGYPTDGSITSFARQNLRQSRNNPAVDPDSLLFTGEALKLKVPERDPQRTPNPDELHKGLWTGEAMNYTVKAQKDFAEQQKYAQEHGGLKAINDRINEHNKQKESAGDSRPSHDPKNAENTREKMKDFYNRNDEITSQHRNPYYSTSGRESQKSVAENTIFNNNKEGIKGLHQSGKAERLKPKKIEGSSSRIGLGSSAGSSSSSESSSSSSSETYSEAGVNSESGTTAESNTETEPSESDVPSFDQDTAVDESDQVWTPDDDYFVDLNEEENLYNDYKTPQGLGVYTDTNIEAGIDSGATAESQVGSDAQSEPEMGFNAGSQSKFPGYGFGNGFGIGLGMNVGSQSGSESMTETSVSVGTSTDSKTESESKIGSNSKTNPGSKSKYKYRWRKGPSTSEKLMPNSMAVLGLHPVWKTGPVEEPFNSEVGLFKGLPDILESKLETLAHHDRPKMVSKDYAMAKVSPQPGTGSTGNHDKPSLDLKDHSRFKAAPQLGIQVGSDAQTQASTSASTLSQSGSNTGSRPLKPRLRLQSHINLEKHRQRLGNRMKSHKDRLDYDTQKNPLRMMKMQEKSPTLMKLEAVAEKTRNKPRGSHGPKANKHHGSGQGNQNTKTDTDPNKVEASVNIQYQGTNTKGVDISANINTVNGQQMKKPSKTKSNNDNNDNIGRYGTGSPYGWYVRDSGHVPSTAELNMKLNSMPYAKYVPQMRKAARRRM